MNRMRKFFGTTSGGFIVPPGYILRIELEDGTELVKNPGEQSGSSFSFSDVLGGLVPGWFVEPTGEVTSLNTLGVHTEVYDIASAIRGAGGNMLFVGGVVRDIHLGIESKDVDIEVYNLTAEQLIRVLSEYGRVDTVGASFGIIKLTTQNYDYDFNLPRRESKQGEGHRGFIVESDPYMTPREAASRRDFSFNGLALTIEGRVLDFFDGIRDLREGRLRHISGKFAEDPLRVLRGFQFASRFEMTMDDSTAELAQTLKREYTTLAKERIWGEWEKWAAKGVKPSAGLEVLEKTGWIDFYPQLKSLTGVQQQVEWHPEGDVWVHTKHVADEAARIADRDGLKGEDRVVLVFAALCHDFGKPDTTTNEDGKWRAPGHPQAGVQPTKDFLRDIGMPEYRIQKIGPLVSEHMAHLNDVTPKSVRRLAMRLDPSNIEMLARVIESDQSGRPPLPKELPKEAKEMMVMARQISLEAGKPTPVMGGKHLMSLAMSGEIPEDFMRGGPHFSHMLKSLFEAQLDGAFSDEASGILYLKRRFSLEQENAIVPSGAMNRSQMDELDDLG